MITIINWSMQLHLRCTKTSWEWVWGDFLKLKKKLDHATSFYLIEYWNCIWIHKKNDTGAEGWGALGQKMGENQDFIKQDHAHSSFYLIEYWNCNWNLTFIKINDGKQIDNWKWSIFVTILKISLKWTPSPQTTCNPPPLMNNILW